MCHQFLTKNLPTNFLFCAILRIRLEPTFNTKSDLFSWIDLCLSRKSTKNLTFHLSFGGTVSHINEDEFEFHPLSYVPLVPGSILKQNEAKKSRNLFPKLCSIKPLLSSTELNFQCKITVYCLYQTPPLGRNFSILAVAHLYFSEEHTTHAKSLNAFKSWILETSINHNGTGKLEELLC